VTESWQQFKSRIVKWFAFYKMSFNKIIKREIEVAFSKHAQPIWFRIFKYILLGLIIYLFWGTRLLWIILFVLFVLAMLLHFWYRYKTNGWI